MIAQREEQESEKSVENEVGHRVGGVGCGGDQPQENLDTGMIRPGCADGESLEDLILDGKALTWDRGTSQDGWEHIGF